MMKFLKSNIGLGIILVILPFILERYTNISNFANGLIRGIGLGILFVGAYRKIKERAA